MIKEIKNLHINIVCYGDFVERRQRNIRDFVERESWSGYIKARISVRVVI